MDHGQGAAGEAGLAPASAWQATGEARQVDVVTGEATGVTWEATAVTSQVKK